MAAASDLSRRLYDLAESSSDIPALRNLIQQATPRELNADPEKDGWTPLHAACENGHLAVMQMLMEADANIEAADSCGWTLLFIACFNGLPQQHWIS